VELTFDHLGMFDKVVEEPKRPIDVDLR